MSGIPGTFDHRINCLVDLANGRGTFVIGSFEAPVVKMRPNRINYLMKILIGKFYWLSLRGLFNPMFDLYFRPTAPPPQDAVKRTVAAPQ